VRSFGTVRFVGVDLAWTARGGTGLCAVEANAVRASARVGTDEELLGWLEPFVQDEAVVAIDAPLIVRNLVGRRRAEQLISRCFGAYHASAHSANLGLPSFRNGVRGEWLAAALGLEVDPAFPPGMPVRRAVEVYPHTAIVALFGLASTLKYKAKPGRTLQSRSAALGELLEHLESLATADPPLDVRSSPRWLALRATVAAPTSGSELARAEDEIDAYVCAYTGLYYWTHGTARCRIAGDVTEGYILTPVTPALAACLDRHSSERVPPPEDEKSHLVVALMDQPKTRLELNATRVRDLLPDATVRSTPHVIELAVGGEGGLVVLVTAEAVELRLPTIEWTGGSHGPAEASRFWKRLNTNALAEGSLIGVIEAAREARRAEFATCRYCRERFAVEHRVSDNVCHGCASRYEGVVF
jgi:predicted RNase H-like nuclease